MMCLFQEIGFFWGGAPLTSSIFGEKNGPEVLIIKNQGKNAKNRYFFYFSLGPGAPGPALDASAA